MPAQPCNPARGTKPIEGAALLEVRSWHNFSNTSLRFPSLNRGKFNCGAIRARVAKRLGKTSASGKTTSLFKKTSVLRVDATDASLAAVDAVVGDVHIDARPRPVGRIVRGMARAYPFFSPALDTCMFSAAPRCWYCMSLTIPRSVIISGRKTSVRLEPAFWVALQEIADKRFMTLPDLIATIEAERKYQNSNCLHFGCSCWSIIAARLPTRRKPTAASAFPILLRLPLHRRSLRVLKL